MPDDELVDRLRANQQALCIVNTRRHAKGLYDLLDKDGAFHLSTLMCPVHRKTTLDEIRKRLKAGQLCRVISTQVMEAGIDVDFPIGFRALAGLDSIIQAAGRVNREMRNSSSDVFVFRPQTHFVKRTPEFIKQTASVADQYCVTMLTIPQQRQRLKSTTRCFTPCTTNAISMHKRSLDTSRSVLGKPDFDFKTAAEKFKLIDQSAVTVFIPYDDDAKRKIELLKYVMYPASILRQLQLYAVNIYENEFENLQTKGAIQTIADTYHVLDPEQMQLYYDPATDW